MSQEHITKKLNVIQVNSVSIDKNIWKELKTKHGVFRENAFDFFIWVEELEDMFLTHDTSRFISTVLNETHEKVDVIHFS